MSSTVVTTVTAAATQSPTAKRPAKARSAKVRPFGSAVRKIAASTAKEVPDAQNGVGQRQTDSANAFLNGVSETLLVDIMNYMTLARSVYAKPGNAGRIGDSFSVLKPRHLEAYIRSKFSPSDAAIILDVIRKHRESVTQ